MGGYVKLSDVEAALDGSIFSVPRDKLRVFGHVTLEVKTRARPEELENDLAAMEFVSVGESKTDQDVLLVTVDMPYWRSFGAEMD